MTRSFSTISVEYPQLVTVYRHGYSEVAKSGYTFKPFYESIKHSGKNLVVGMDRTITVTYVHRFPASAEFAGAIEGFTVFWWGAVGGMFGSQLVDGGVTGLVGTNLVCRGFAVKGLCV